MKAYFWLPFCCLLGFLIGSWGSKEESFNLQREVDLLERTPQGKPLAGFDALARMTHIPEVSSKRGRPKRTVKKETVTPADAPARQQAENAQGNPDRIEISISDQGIRSTDLRARIEEAKELWKVRMDIARTQALAELGLEQDEKTEAFDKVMGEMNEKLYGLVEEIAAGLQDQESMTPELAVKLMAVMGDTLADTYDRVGDLVPPEKRNAVSGMQMTDFIDPIVAEPLIGVQDKLQQRQ